MSLLVLPPPPLRVFPRASACSSFLSRGASVLLFLFFSLGFFLSRHEGPSFLLGGSSRESPNDVSSSSSGSSFFSSFPLVLVSGARFLPPRTSAIKTNRRQSLSLYTPVYSRLRECLRLFDICTYVARVCVGIYTDRKKTYAYL